MKEEGMESYKASQLVNEIPNFAWYSVTAYKSPSDKATSNEDASQVKLKCRNNKRQHETVVRRFHTAEKLKITDSRWPLRPLWRKTFKSVSFVWFPVHAVWIYNDFTLPSGWLSSQYLEYAAITCKVLSNYLRWYMNILFTHSTPQYNWAQSGLQTWPDETGGKAA
jgi:hypothetical protein